MEACKLSTDRDICGVPQRWSICAPAPLLPDKEFSGVPFSGSLGTQSLVDCAVTVCLCKFPQFVVMRHRRYQEEIRSYWDYIYHSDLRWCHSLRALMRGSSCWRPTICNLSWRVLVYWCRFPRVWKIGLMTWRFPQSSAKMEMKPSFECVRFHDGMRLICLTLTSKPLSFISFSYCGGYWLGRWACYEHKNEVDG